MLVSVLKVLPAYFYWMPSQFSEPLQQLDPYFPIHVKILPLHQYLPVPSYASYVLCRMFKMIMYFIIMLFARIYVKDRIHSTRMWKTLA